MFKETIESYMNALELFKTIPDWRDVNEQTIVCRRKIEELKNEEKNERKKIEKRRMIFAIFVVIILFLVGEIYL